MLKVLLDQAIFFATRVAILLQHNLQEKLPSVTCPEMKCLATFLLLQSLREVEVGSTFRNNPRNAATNFSDQVT